MSAHTPGPWKIGKYETTVVSEAPIRNVSPYSGHADTHRYGGYLIAESIWRREDGRLIAAAPDLYEALNLVLDGLGALTKPHELAEYIGPDADKVWAALAKASGEQQ